jgi:hypothetical protein
MMRGLWVGYLLICVGTGGVIALSATRTTPQEGDIAAYVTRAKQRGKKQITVTVNGDSSDANASAEQFLRPYTVIYGTPLNHIAVAEASEISLYTWQRLRVEETLRVGPLADAAFCQNLPRPARLPKIGQLSVAYMGGTAMVRGVAVTVNAGRPVSLRPGRAYVIIGLQCGDNTIALAHGALDVYDVGRTGYLDFSTTEADAPFVQKFKELKSIPALRAYLNSF